MRDIQSDLGVLHALLSEHMPGVTITIFKKNNINIDIEKITQTVNNIYKEHLQNEPLTNSILITQLLLQEVYTQVNKQAKEHLEEESKDRKALEFIAGYC